MNQKETLIKCNYTLRSVKVRRKKEKNTGAGIARITRRRSHDDLAIAVCSRLSSSTSFAPYPKPEASPHDSVRRGGFRVSRTSHRVNAIFSSIEDRSPSFVLLVPRCLARNDHLRIRGSDRAIPRQRAIMHPL